MHILFLGSNTTVNTENVFGPTTGATSAGAAVAPEISNFGYGGTLTAGTLNYYTTGGASRNTLLFTDPQIGTVAHKESFSTTAFRDAARTAILDALGNASPAISISTAGVAVVL